MALLPHDLDGEVHPGPSTLTEDELRLAVGRLRARERREQFDPEVHVGALGGPHERYVVRADDVPVLDAGLRTDVVGRLLEAHTARAGGASAAVWLTRPGDPTPQDADLAWMAAAEGAFAAADLARTGFWAVTRTGWLDVRTGASRTWRRLRL